MNIPEEILFMVLDATSTAPLYISEKTWPEDFKPHKWEPYRDEAAEEMVNVHHALLYAMLRASGLTPHCGHTGCPATNLAGEFCCYRRGHSEEMRHRFVKLDK